MIRLFSIIALLVLSVSVSSAFVESAYAEGHESIAEILEITHNNILDSLQASGIEPDNVLFSGVEAEYQKALADLDGDDIDIVAAKESVIQAMASFEDTAIIINSLENQASTLLPPGFGAGFDSASDTGITQGQGLGVGGIPSGILGVVEEIAYSESEAEDYRELVKVNNLDGIDFGEFDNKVNLAKTLLAEGLVPDAQVQLILANQIKEQIYDKIDAAGDVNAIEGIEALLEDQKNLGLTKKVIREFEEVLGDLDTGDGFAPEEGSDAPPGNSGDAPGQEDRDSPPGNSGDAPGQEDRDSPPGNSGDAPGQEDRDSPPGNSGDAPGQNKDNDEAELPPGFGAAEDNPSGTAIDNENAVGLGLGKETIPPGQLKKLGYSLGYDQSPDDYYENHFEGSVDDDFEGSYDGTNKGYGDGKGKFGKWAGKSGADPSGKANAKGNQGGGNPNCTNEGITDNDSTKTSGQVGVPYVVEDFTAVGSSCQDAEANQILIQVTTPPPMPFVENLNQGQSFTPTTAEDYTITASFQGQFLSRVVTVVAGGNNAPTVTNTIPDYNINEDHAANTLDLGLVFDDAEDADAAMAYTVQSNSNPGLVAITVPTAGNTGMTITYTAITSGTATITIRATDTGAPGLFVDETFVVTIAGACTDSVGTGTGTWSPDGTCTVIEDGFSIGNNYGAGDDVRVGANFSAPGGQGGPGGGIEIGDGAIVGANVTDSASQTDIGAGVIIPDGITL